MIKPVFKLMFRATMVDENPDETNVLLTFDSGYIGSKDEYTRLIDEVNRHTNINLYNCVFINRPGEYSDPELWNDRGYPGTNHFRVHDYDTRIEDLWYDIDIVYVIEIDGRYFELPEIFYIENK